MDVDRYTMRSLTQAGQFNGILKNSNPQCDRLESRFITARCVTVVAHRWNIKPQTVHGAQHGASSPVSQTYICRVSNGFAEQNMV